MHIGVERNLDQWGSVEASRVLSPARGRALAAPSPPSASLAPLAPRGGCPGHPRLAHNPLAGATRDATPIPCRSLPMALFEFLPRAAPARFVASRQLARWRSGGWSAVATCPGCCRRPAATCLRRLRLLFLLCLLCRSYGHAEDGLGDAAGDPGLHLLKEAVRLAFVGDERVLLAVAAQVDTLAELLHRSEVLDPVRVDRSEEDPSLDRAGELLAELVLARFVRLLDDLGDAVSQLGLVA